ncbi:MAG: hypothetical protein GKR97_05140 [Rhizobiaceae bacterium]|nr:hypothetical protein [Rhizobiaceae bacterium]
MIYTIFGPSDFGSNGQETSAFDSLVAVPEGPATWALLAPPIWLIAHRLWWPLAYCLLFWAFCATLLTTPFAVIAIFINGLPGLYFMLEGRELYRRKLENEGMIMIGLIDAASEPAAIGRFLDDQQHQPTLPSSQTVPAPAKASPQLLRGSGDSTDVFGLFTPRET